MGLVPVLRKHLRRRRLQPEQLLRDHSCLEDVVCLIFVPLGDPGRDFPQVQLLELRPRWLLDLQDPFCCHSVHRILFPTP